VPPGPVARLLRRGDLTPRIVDAWRDLADRAAELNPCNEPDALLPAMRHLTEGSRVNLLVVMTGERLDACLPVLRVPRWRAKVPVPALISWTHPYQLLGTPLVDREHAAETLAAMLRAPRTVRGGAQLLSIEDLGDGGPVAAALDEAAASIRGRVVRWESHERAVLTRSDDETSGPSGGRHKRVRRSRRALERVAGPVTVTDRAKDDDAVGLFLALEASGWKGRAGTALASNPADAAFFRELCRRFLEADRLEMRSLETSAGPVAMQTAVRAGDGIFHFKIAYDEEYGAYSPGVQLLVDFADRFPEESIAFRDSCTGAGNVTESHVWPGRRTVTSVLMPFASTASRSVVAALGAARTRRGRKARM